jgi:DNA-binding transcriptional ArsR family regulator
MIRYQLTGMDLADVRFAISPVNELVLSMRAWRDPGRYPLLLPWLRQVQEARPRLDAELLSALVNARLWTPDFLAPRPRSALTRIEDELAAVRRTPAEVVRRDLNEVHGVGDHPPVLNGSTSAVVDRIVNALATYWDLCFAPHWTRMRTLLEADVIHRGREAANHGLARMFAGLAETVTFDEGVVSVQQHTGVDYTRSTTGDGLTLMPTMFTRTTSVPITPAEPPHILYGVRGLGTLWEMERTPAPEALVGLIGRVRTELLARLATPASTTELAARAGVTPAAVNQHLRALHAAGLLASTRYGRSVLYQRSELGDRLFDR